MTTIVEIKWESVDARGGRRARGRVQSPRVRIYQLRAWCVRFDGRGRRLFTLRVVLLELHPVVDARRAPPPPVRERAERRALEHAYFEVGPGVVVAERAEEVPEARPRHAGHRRNRGGQVAALGVGRVERPARGAREGRRGRARVHAVVPYHKRRRSTAGLRVTADVAAPRGHGRQRHATDETQPQLVAARREVERGQRKARVHLIVCLRFRHVEQPPRGPRRAPQRVRARAEVPRHGEVVVGQRADGPQPSDHEVGLAALLVALARHEELDDGLDAACGGGVLKSVLAEGSSGSTHQGDDVARPHPSVFVPVPVPAAGLVLN